MRILICALFFVLGGAGGAFGAGRAQLTEEQSLASVAAWFSIGPAARSGWEVSLPDPDDSRRILMTPRGDATGDRKTVMVIYPRRSSAYDIAMTTMLVDFGSRDMNLQFLAVNYDRDPAIGARLVQEARENGHALIYAMGSETVAWLHDTHPEIAVPVVTVCAKDPVQLGQMRDYVQGSGTAFAFTSLNVMLDIQVAHLMALRPGLRNLGVMVDMRNVSAVETQALPIIEALEPLGIDAFMVAVTDPAAARDQLAEAIPAALSRMRESDPDLANSLFWITGSTSIFSEMELITAMAEQVPVLAVVPEVVQAGRHSAVLSIGVSFESNAQLAAHYGAEVLSGRAQPGDLAVGVVSPPDIAINFLRAREIGMQVPFGMFETASFVYDTKGQPVRMNGVDLLERSR
jgi:putative ABC transport system substrate-binding protein